MLVELFSYSSHWTKAVDDGNDLLVFSWNITKDKVVDWIENRVRTSNCLIFVASFLNSETSSGKELESNIIALS